MSEYTFQRGKSFVETERDMRPANTDTTTRGLLHAAEPHPALQGEPIEVAENVDDVRISTAPADNSQAPAPDAPAALIDAEVFNAALAKTGIDFEGSEPAFVQELVREWLASRNESEAREAVGDAGYEALVNASTEASSADVAEPLALSNDDASLLEYLRAHETDLNDEQRATLLELERREAAKTEESPAQ